MAAKIDKLDLKILDIISKDARIPLSEVAEKCKVSRAVVHQRVSKLSEKNAILGSGYHVNPLMIGYSTYALIVIRSSANPPMDQNSPEDIFTLGKYLSRDQYGDRPLSFGDWLLYLRLCGDQSGKRLYV